MFGLEPDLLPALQIPHQLPFDFHPRPLCERSRLQYANICALRSLPGCQKPVARTENHRAGKKTTNEPKKAALREYEP